MSTQPTAARANWIDPACALCGSRERTVVRRDDSVSLVRCAQCALVYITPRRSGAALIAEVYDESYWRSPAARDRGYSDYRGDEARYLETFRRRLDGLSEHLPRSGRVLELGCAAGYCLRVLEERGFDCYGIEPSAAIRATALQHFGPQRIHAGTLEDSAFEPASFDLILMWDVIEHLPEPLDVLRKLRTLLRPEGRLVVETQNIEALAARVLGRRWTHFKHDEHLLHFSRATLQRALESSGFELRSMSARGAGKLVSPAFLAERALRIAPWLGFGLKPLARFSKGSVYINPFDELIAVAAPRAAQ